MPIKRILFLLVIITHYGFAQKAKPTSAVKSFIKFPSTLPSIPLFLDRQLLDPRHPLTKDTSAITELLSRCKGKISDADIFAEIAGIYENINENAAQKKYAKKSIDLFQRQIQEHQDRGALRKLVQVGIKVLPTDSLQAHVDRLMLEPKKNREDWEVLGSYFFSSHQYHKARLMADTLVSLFENHVEGYWLNYLLDLTENKTSASLLTAIQKKRKDDFQLLSRIILVNQLISESNTFWQHHPDAEIVPLKHFHQNKLHELTLFFNDLLKKYQEVSSIHEILMYIAYLDEDQKAMDNHFQQFVQINPFFPNICTTYALMGMHQKRYQKALDGMLLKKELVDESFEDSFLIAHIYYQLEKWDLCYERLHHWYLILSDHEEIQSAIIAVLLQQDRYVQCKWFLTHFETQQIPSFLILNFIYHFLRKNYLQAQSIFQLLKEENFPHPLIIDNVDFESLKIKYE